MVGGYKVEGGGECVDGVHGAMNVMHIYQLHELLISCIIDSFSNVMVLSN